MPLFKAATAVLAAIALLWALTVWLGAKEDQFFTAALKEARVSVAPDATLRVKKLTYAKTLAQNNPLAALPGTSADEMDAAVAGLQKLEQDVYKLNASSSKAQLLYSLYPTGFLGALSTMERARQKFIASGSSADEAAYNAAALKTFAVYQSDASAFAKAFAVAVPMDSGKFATDGDIISRADILSATDKLIQHMRATADRFMLRMQCTRGDTRKCSAGDLKTPAIILTPEVALSPQRLAQAKAVRALSAQAHGQPAIAEGPMLLLPSTECATHMGGGAPLFVFYTPAGGSTKQYPLPLYIGNIRFNTTNENASSTYGRFNKAMQKNVSYILDSPMLHYKCFELAHDNGKLSAMRAVYMFAQSHSLSGYASTTPNRNALALLEQKDLAVLSQKDVEQYLNAAEPLSVPDGTAYEVRELSLAYLNNSSHFDADIGNIRNYEEANISLVREGWPVALDVSYEFFIRSAFSMLLLADNQSATGIKEGGMQKLFPPNTLPKSVQPFIYYSELPHTPAMIQTLIHDIHFYNSIHVDPSLVSGLVK